MNNKDYIGKALELADGFERSANWSISIVSAYESVEAKNILLDDQPSPENQWLLDALAAQLVRQVDALPKIHFETGGVGQVNVWRESEQWDKRTSVEGPDRTMTTLKCIVDSGVLSTGGSK